MSVNESIESQAIRSLDEYMRRYFPKTIAESVFSKKASGQILTGQTIEKYKALTKTLVEKPK